MPTRNVVLTKHHEDVIETLVSTGRYQNASEVMREGLRLIEQREAEDHAKLTALREAARIGFQAIGRGDYEEFQDMQDMNAYLDELTEEVIRSLSE